VDGQSYSPPARSSSPTGSGSSALTGTASRSPRREHGPGCACRRPPPTP
jgi:hypothetical protein